MANVVQVDRCIDAELEVIPPFVNTGFGNYFLVLEDTIADCPHHIFSAVSRQRHY